jgi:CubicO group peptidase (beta-lactamase class C family)
MGNTAINGHAAAGFSAVEDVFRENFRKRGEVGASCAVVIEGQKVVDLWGGFADAQKTRAWNYNTKALVFSSTKGMSSLAFAILHSKGLLDFDERVSTYWPEFGSNGKKDITVRQLLAHEAGLMVIDKLLDMKTIRDKDKLADILARQRPFRKVLGKKAYHTWTISLYQSELSRRIDPLNRSIGSLFRDEIAQPLDADFHIGIPRDLEEDELAAVIPFKPWRSAIKTWNEVPLRLALNFMNPFSISARSFMNPPVALSPMIFNQRYLHELEIGSATGVGSARAMARIYGEFACGGKLLNVAGDTIRELENFPENVNNTEEDLVLKENLIYSLGLEKPGPFFNFGSSKKAYGHQGAGGSAAFADPDNKLGFSYVMNQMGTNVANDPREKALRDAVYSCL